MEGGANKWEVWENDWKLISATVATNDGEWTVPIRKKDVKATYFIYKGVHFRNLFFFLW